MADESEKRAKIAAEEEEEESENENVAGEHQEDEADENEDDEEMKIIQEEYRVWKKNAPFLYDVCLKHNLPSAPLTCQWLPPKTEVESEYSSHEILVGMKRTETVTNCLSVMKVFLPNESAELEVKEFSDKTNELGGYAANVSKLNSLVEITHDGDVNRARYMPSDYFIVATRMGHHIGIFKFDQMESKPREGSKCKPKIIGVGHSEEGYGLDWSPRTPGHLLSCGGDGTYLWNIDRSTSAPEGIQPLRTFSGSVADCAWDPFKTDVFATVSLEGKIGATKWDIRDSKPVFNIEYEGEELNSLSFNPLKEHIFVTGGSGKVVHLWDDRKIVSNKPQYELKGHMGEIYGIQWAPFNENILASCGEDRRVLIWDLERIGKEQTPEEAEDGDPELLFSHAGHCSRVMDVSWNPNDDWVLASVADNGEDGDLQIWQPSANIYLDEEDDDEDADDLE